MLRLFVRLYVLLALVLGLYLAGVAFYSGSLLRGTIADYYHQLSRGTYALAMERLRPLPQSQWPAAVKKLSGEFGYPVELVRRTDIDIPPSDRERLRHGLTAFNRGSVGGEFWYLPIDNSPWVLQVQMVQSLASQREAMTIGTFHLIADRLGKDPQARWPATMTAIQALFRYPVALLPRDTLTLKPSQVRHLDAGHVLALGPDSGHSAYLWRVPNSDQVLRLGPMDDPLLARSWGYLIYAVLALLLALAIWFWIAPLWRNVMELRRVTGALGHGQLSVRARMSQRAPLALLGTTFNQMAARIQQLIDSHRELTNAVSHELRTPISRLRFATEMLEQAQQPADRQRHLRSLRTDIDELDLLVEELLVFARFEREQPQLQRESIVLHEWLQQRCERQQQTPGAPRLSCVEDGLDDTLTLHADPRLLARAVDNLLANARRYGQRQVRLSVEREDADVTIHVDDDGPGIPAEERQRVFEPFTRLDRSRDRETGGYGLGLAIVRRIAELHGGEVRIGDSPLYGARLSLRLPLR